MNRIFALAVAIAIACFASTALAQQAFTLDKPQVSVHAAGGIYMGDYVNVNPYGFGLGARAGYTLNPGVYVGGLFDFFFGETDESQGTVGIVTGTVEETANAWLVQGEVGYDLALSPSVVLRPKAGIGATQVNAETCARTNIVLPFVPNEACNDQDDGNFAFALGLEALFSFDGLFVAPEARFNIVDDNSAFILALGVGAAF